MKHLSSPPAVVTEKRDHKIIRMPNPTWRRSLFGWMAALLLFSLSAHTDVYVSPTGSDDNCGTKDKPFATLERARAAIREIKQNGSRSDRRLTVWLRGGDYLRENTLELTEEDSGTEPAPVVWRAYRNEKVRLRGGKTISGFQPVADADLRARFSESAQDHILFVDLNALSIKDYGLLHSRGFGRPTTPSHGELFFNGHPMTPARWPNAGNWELIAGFPEHAGQGDDHGGNIGGLEAGFHYADERPNRWQHAPDLWVHGYWAYDWANSYEKVVELDAERKFIRTEAPHGLYGFRTGQRFYYVNILEELDEPGEWFLDKATGLLYFWPPESCTDAETIFSILEKPFLQMKNVRHVFFQGILMEAGRGTAIEINGGEGNRIVGCLIRNMGNWAVSIQGGVNHGVQSCDLTDMGDGGVSLSGGDRQTLAPGNHFVDNCRFTRLGRWSKCYVPAVLMNGVGLRASHNLIHDHPHCAILYGGNDHLIEFNDIHHIALETGDVGAIYAGRDYSFRGNRILHNYIHETGGVGMGSMGVYMDDCVSGTEVFGNVFYKVHWAMFIGGGRDHRVINNLFVDCDPAVRADGRGMDTSPVWRTMVDKTMRERLAQVPLPLYRERYPEMKTLDAWYGDPAGDPIVGNAFTGVPPEGNSIARNVCIGDWMDMAWHAQQELFDIQDNFVTPNLKYCGSPESGFRLPRNSPAWAKGFKAIPFDKIGLLPDKNRKHLEKVLARP